ncbi:acyl-ACP--UDP-N-acetylglucosamine O-acyltransferase [Bacteriovoracaceae bacterium]|nr:acyl-ACP--UDP-N-acetylglucosamine O-acyltransferase [Bacteriovoracaceae bacterium]
MSEVIIHETSIVSPEAQLGRNVEIGPYCIIGDKVKLGDGARLRSHVTMEGNVTVGENVQIYQYTNIGNPPQDLSYKDEDTRVEIGDNCIIREFSSIHRGTPKDNGVTKVGNNVYLMAYVHLAHDCILGNNVMFVNGVQCAGHVKIGDNARISGHSKMTQFVTIGRNAFIGGDSTIDKDIPDYCTAYGNRARLKGINIIGLKRAGFSKANITEVVDFYRTMEASALSPRAFVSHPELMEDYVDNKIIQDISSFISVSEIGIAPFWD